MFSVYSIPRDVSHYLDEVTREADREKDALGFLPEGVYKEAVTQGKLIVATHRGWRHETFAGHLLFGGVFPHGRIFQVYVRKKFRKQGVGRLLIDELVKQAEKASYLSLSARVADDLEANAFWSRMGFEHVRTAPGGATRNRSINIRVRELDSPHLFRTRTAKESLADLRLVERLSARAPQYVIDLNVMFDVVRKRVNAEYAGRIMTAGFNNLIRLAVTGEFIEELKRHSTSPDPVLEFALQLPILPQPLRQDIVATLSLLAAEIFPDRARRGSLTDRDRSDLIHLATAIAHEAAGFITSEKAILRSRGYLQEQYGIDVVGVSEMAALAEGAGPDDFSRISFVSSELRLQVRHAERADMAKISELLKRLGVADQLIAEVSADLSSEVAEQRLVLAGERPIAFSSSVKSPGLMQAFVCGDEDSAAIETALEHILDSICRSASHQSPAVVRLRLLSGHSKTRTVATSHGFRPNADQPENAAQMQKLCVGRSLNPEDWLSIRSQLRTIAGLSLPQSMPEFIGPSQLLEVSTPTGETISIRLRDLETLLSPVLLLLPKRTGAVVPIRPRFAEDLFGSSAQLKLLESSEACLLRERVYFSDPRTSPLLKESIPILFYESGKGSGRSSIIALARVLRTDLVSKESVLSELLRRGVLSQRALEKMGRSPFLAATSFDNLMHFRKLISLARLRELGFHDPANLITAREIPSDVLTSVIREGQPNV